MATDGAREQILAAAGSALVDDPSLTMAELATVAGVSLRQLYRQFGSRDALLNALDLEPAPGARERILDAALTLLSSVSLAELSMDELASLSDVSRATL